MAEQVKPKGTIDIDALLQAEKARAAKSKAESEAAAKANAARKAATQYDQAVKFVVSQKNDRIQSLEQSIADSLFGINRIVRNRYKDWQSNSRNNSTTRSRWNGCWNCSGF